MGVKNFSKMFKIAEIEWSVQGQKYRNMGHLDIHYFNIIMVVKDH